MAVNKKNPWGEITFPPAESMNFASIVRNQKLEKQLQQTIEREKRQTSHCDDPLKGDIIQILQDESPLPTQCDFNIPNDVLDYLATEEREYENNLAMVANGCESDEVIAQMLQAQFDREYNEDLKRIEKSQNKQSKVTVCLDKYKRTYFTDVGEKLDENDNISNSKCSDNEHDWDRFEANKRLFETVRKSGYMLDEEGDIITKHDADVCGIRNVCRMMSFPLEMATGDGACFDMKLSNRVFNELKTYSNKTRKKNSHMQDRKDHKATAEMGMDGGTRLLLYKLINNQVLEKISGIISTGKEAVILHANIDPNYSNPYAEQPQIMPKECAVKIFKTTLNDFKQRDRYIKDDYRFKDRFNVRFSKQNNIIIISMWAEKEMHNLLRMQKAHINCPAVVLLKKHLLVMQFIGENGQAAPKLKDAILTTAQWAEAYDQIVHTMHKLYNEAKLVHADLSEYNILWHQNSCWFIDVAQSVEPQHPGALEYLMRDCKNITDFFGRKDLDNIYSREQLFEHITGLNAETLNVTMLERIHTKGTTVKIALDPNQEQRLVEILPLEYPFDEAWENTRQEKIISNKAATSLNLSDTRVGVSPTETSQIM